MNTCLMTALVIRIYHYTSSETHNFIVGGEQEGKARSTYTNFGHAHCVLRVIPIQFIKFARGSVDCVWRFHNIVLLGGQPSNMTRE